MPASHDQPALATFNIRGGMVLKPEFTALWFALSVYTSSFITEIVRSGIQAVSHGQTEAAYALGVRPNWTMRLIVIRSEEHTSELQSLMRISYAVFCLNKQKQKEKYNKYYKNNTTSHTRS